MIEKLFSDYIFLTKNILSGIKNGISVEEYFEKREKLIKDIIELDASKEDKKAEYESSGAKELDEKLYNLWKYHKNFGEIGNINEKENICCVHRSDYVYGCICRMRFFRI